MESLNKIGQNLANGLLWSRSLREQDRLDFERNEKINVTNAGSVISSAYEQLRNAADNNEEHLLLQNAIRRFLKKIFLTKDEKLLGESGEELVIELTLAGYMVNSTITSKQADIITSIAKECYYSYDKLRKLRPVGEIKALAWTLDVASVEIATILQPKYEDKIFSDFAYEYFLSVIPKSVFGRSKNADAVVFVSVQKALLNNDIAATRANLLDRYGVRAADTKKFLEINQQIDKLIDLPIADEIYHTINRQGASLRVIKRMIASRDDMPELLKKHSSFVGEFSAQIDREYKKTASRIDRAVVRSVIFLIITKMLVGLAIEIPYDLIAHNAILWVPLVINLLFPPVFIVLLRTTLIMPGRANTTALIEYATNILYGGNINTIARSKIGRKHYGAVFSVFYALISVAVLAGVSYLLTRLQFAPVHIAIFVLFFSAASFLGFRLGRLVRDIEIVKPDSNFITIIRDFIYMPFVIIGQWMSDKYNRVNIVATIMDLVIEMPLKTVLRLIRQWTAFIDDRKDNLL